MRPVILQKIFHFTPKLVPCCLVFKEAAFVGGFLLFVPQHIAIGVEGNTLEKFVEGFQRLNPLICQMPQQ